MKRDIRLLIVDDNVATRYALRRRLERHGYEVLEAGTGSEGLELIASVTIDALILDVNLPDMSGFDIVRKLRSDARDRPAPGDPRVRGVDPDRRHHHRPRRRRRRLPDPPGRPGCAAGDPAHLAAGARNRKCPA